MNPQELIEKYDLDEYVTIETMGRDLDTVFVVSVKHPSFSMVFSTKYASNKMFNVTIRQNGAVVYVVDEADPSFVATIIPSVITNETPRGFTELVDRLIDDGYIPAEIGARDPSASYAILAAASRVHPGITILHKRIGKYLVEVNLERRGKRFIGIEVVSGVLFQNTWNNPTVVGRARSMENAKGIVDGIVNGTIFDPTVSTRQFPPNSCETK